MKNDTFRNDILKLIFQATGIANLADNAASSPLTNLYAALHTADPGNAGVQNTSECAYGSYARVAVARSGSGWTVTTNKVSPAADITFPTCTSGSETATMFSVGVASSGATKILRRGVIGSRLGPFVGATSDTITIPGLSGLAVDERVVFLAVDGSSLPTGITGGVAYWVKTVSGDNMTISATQGGSTLDITAAGDGLAYKSTPIVITTTPAVTPKLTTASEIVEE